MVLDQGQDPAPAQVRAVQMEFTQLQEGVVEVVGIARMVGQDMV
jgi:hypothetical protein